MSPVTKRQLAIAMAQAGRSVAEIAVTLHVSEERVRETVADLLVPKPPIITQAAARDLLEACRAALPLISTTGGNDLTWKQTEERCDEVSAMIRAALAKAEGKEGSA